MRNVSYLMEKPDRQTRVTVGHGFMNEADFGIAMPSCLDSTMWAWCQLTKPSLLLSPWVRNA